MWDNQENRARVPAGTCLEGPMQLNMEEQPCLKNKKKLPEDWGEARVHLRGRQVPGVEVHLGPCLFTWGVEPRGKKVVYFKCYHGHMEVALLWEFQEDQQEKTVYFPWKHMEDFLLFFPFISRCWKSPQKPIQFLADSRAEESDYLLHLVSKKCSLLLAKGVKQRNNSTYPRNPKVCLHLLQAQNSVIWGSSAAYPGMPSEIKPSEDKQVH